MCVEVAAVLSEVFMSSDIKVFEIFNYAQKAILIYSKTCIRQPLLRPLKSGCLGQMFVLQNTFIKWPLSKFGHSWQAFSFFPRVIVT